MRDQYYGYEPTPTTAHGFFAGDNDDYAEDPGVSYSPTPWDKLDIEQMWEYVRHESDERTVALAEAWRRTSVLLQTTRESLKRHADGLAAKWQSPAGHHFMTKVGAALHSLDEWREVADRHANGLEQVASKIEQTQEDMRALWVAYQDEQEHQHQKRKADEGIQWAWGGIPDLWNNGKSFEEVQRDFHERAKNIAKPLAELFMDVSYTNIYRGGRYKGPIDAAVISADQIPLPARPNAPAGLQVPAPHPEQPSLPARPNAPTGLQAPAPTMPGDQPELPDHLDVTQPSPPELSDGVGLAGGTVTAPPPTLGPPPATAPAPTPPTPAPPPVIPGVSGPANPRPTMPTTTNRPSTPHPTLPGANNPGARGPAPQRPTPPSTGTPNPTNRGPAGSRPTLPGNTGTPGPHSPHPGQSRTQSAKPTPPAPTLNGKHGASPRTSPPSVGQPIPPATNRPNPSTGSGTRGSGPLTGRKAAGGPRPAPSTGPAPSLGGRRSTPTRRTGARQAGEETQNWRYGEGDNELWTTDPPPAGTIDTPTEQRPRHHGRTLGQS